MLIFIIHAVLVVGFTIRVLLRNDLTPVSRLAWFMVIAIVPVFGSFIYFLFGEVYLGPAITSRMKTITQEVFDAGKDALGDAGHVEQAVDLPYRSAFRFASSINGFQTVPGNRAELLKDAASARQRLIDDIDAATEQVHVLYYIWLDDQTGTDMAHALIRAAERGVTCRAMADGLGSRAMIGSALWKEMKEAGVHLAVAFPVDHPIRTMITSRLDLRNHRKITIIDGRITYCGSQNCADPEFRVKPQFAPWIDIMLRVEGPVVAQNQLLFVSDWRFANGDQDWPEIEIMAAPVDGGFPAQMMGDGPSERAGSTPQLFSILAGSATRTLTISTPYFVPNATVIDALCAASHRGVQVTLIFPKKNDSWIVAAASRSFYKTLLDAGASIHEFDGGLLHSKTLTIDGRVTFLGSSNMDLRSFDLNYENNILLQDDATTRAVEDRQMDYIASSTQIYPDSVQNWPMHHRVWNNLIATIGPVL